MRQPHVRKSPTEPVSLLDVTLKHDSSPNRRELLGEGRGLGVKVLAPLRSVDANQADTLGVAGFQSHIQRVAVDDGNDICLAETRQQRLPRRR